MLGGQADTKNETGAATEGRPYNGFWGDAEAAEKIRKRRFAYPGLTAPHRLGHGATAGLVALRTTEA
jgi:hypothetical protein